MLVLKPTTDSLEIATEHATSIDYNATWIDHGASGITPSRSVGNISTATTTSIVGAPGAGVTRQIRGVSLVNVTTGSASTVKVQIDNSAVETVLLKVNLHPGDSLHYSDGAGWYSVDAAGKLREQHLDDIESAGAGYQSPFYKVGTAPAAAGFPHFHSLASGMPGSWSAGTPGVAGRIVDGLASADSGSIYLRSSGSFPYAHLRGFTSSTSVSSGMFLIDVLWVNSGISTTTTTAQTIQSLQWPARDLFGKIDGDGVEVGILVTTTMANGTITNTTLNYTGSDGRTNLTATLTTTVSNSPIGTLYPFELAAGSDGVRAVQSITLGTSWGATGAMSLIAYRRLAATSNPIAHVAGEASIPEDGIILWPGASLHLVQIPTSTTATTTQGHVFIVEK